LPKTEVKAEKGTNILNVSKGAYIAGKEKGKADAIIIATGSEVQLAKSIQAMLLKDNIDVRVISMPCMELFNEQNSSYKNELLNLNVPVFVIEYGSSFGFEKYVSSSDYLFNINNYGISASKDEILKYFKLDTESIINKIKSLLK
jgi:transketolase